MALILDYTNTKTGIPTIPNVYFRGTFRHLSRRHITILVEAFSSYTNQNSGKVLFDQTTHSLNINDAAFDTYFSASVLNGARINPFRQLYAYLQTLDTDAPFGLDFTNAVNSLRQGQVNNLSAEEGDRVYNETTETFQTYTSGEWVND